MGFNHIGYNRASFNRPTDTDLYIRVFGSESVSASIGNALDYYTYCIGYEKVLNSVNITQVVFVDAIFNESLDENNIEAQASVLLDPIFAETVSNISDQAAIIRPGFIISENVSNSITANVNLRLSRQGTETVSGRISLGSNIYLTDDGYELVSSLSSLRNIDSKICYLTVSLKPGDIMIVDANNYNVLINQQNAIEVQSGDWIDELNRTTTEIRIDAATGMAGLSATILYTERYLQWQQCSMFTTG